MITELRHEYMVRLRRLSEPRQSAIRPLPRMELGYVCARSDDGSSASSPSGLDLPSRATMMRLARKRQGSSSSWNSAGFMVSSFRRRVDGGSTKGMLLCEQWRDARRDR